MWWENTQCIREAAGKCWIWSKSTTMWQKNIKINELCETIESNLKIFREESKKNFSSHI